MQVEAKSHQLTPLAEKAQGLMSVVVWEQELVSLALKEQGLRSWELGRE